MISTARTGNENLIRVGGFGPSQKSFHDTGDVIAKRVRDAIIDAGGSPEHVLYHDQYVPGQVIFTARVPMNGLVKLIHAIDGDKRVKTVKRASAWFEQRKHVIDMVDHWANNPVGKRNGYKELVTARVAGENDPVVEGTLLFILPFNTIDRDIHAYRTLKEAVVTILKHAGVEISAVDLRGTFTPDIAITTARVTRSQLKAIEKSAKYFYKGAKGAKIVFNEDQQAAIDSVKDIIFERTMADIRNYGVSKSQNRTRASRVLNLIEARFAEEKSIYPIKAVLKIWQNRQNRNVTWSELRNFFESNFTDYKLLGLAATGSRPVFGEDFVLFSATLNEEQVEGWMRSRGSSLAGDEREEYIKGYFDAETAENLRWMTGKCVAPSGKKIMFVKPMEGHNNVNGA